MSPRWLFQASLTVFVIAIIGLSVSFYETSGRVLNEYLYHCGGAGDPDKDACMAVYYRNKNFYENILKLSIPAAVVSGILSLLISLARRNESK